MTHDAAAAGLHPSWAPSSITLRQFIYVMLVLTWPTEIFLLPGPLIQSYGKDALWSIAVGALYALLPIWLGSRILLRTAQGGFFAAALRWGWVGRILLGLAALTIIVPTVTMFEDVELAIHLILIPHTPTIAIAVAILVPVWYGLGGGISPIARVSEVVLPFAMATFLFLYALAMPWFHIVHVMPFVPLQDSALTAGAYKVSTFLAETGMVAVLGTYVDAPPSRIVRGAFTAFAGNTLMLVAATSMPLLLFGARAAAEFVAPPIAAIQLIHYGFLLERLDTIMTPLWVVLVLLKSMVWITVGAALLGAALGFERKVLIAWLTEAVLLGASLSVINMSELTKTLQATWYTSSSPIFNAILGVLNLNLRKVVKPHGQG